MHRLMAANSEAMTHIVMNPKTIHPGQAIRLIRTIRRNLAVRNLAVQNLAG